LFDEIALIIIPPVSKPPFMHSISRRTVLHSATSLAGVAVSAAVLPASAQSFIGPTYMPAQPWTVVVPFPPGGRSSFVAQRLVVALADVLGETVVLEHKTGDSLREVEAFTNLPPDSRTLLMAMVRLPRRGVFKQDPENTMLSRLEPVALVAREPMVLAISAHSARKLKIETLNDLLVYVRKYPGKLTIASGADGGTADQAAELFKTMSQTYINRIAGPKLTTDVNAVIRGEVDVLFENLHLLRTYIQADWLRPLAYTAAPSQPQPNWSALRLNKPVPMLYNQPEFRGFEIHDHHTLFAPPGMDAQEIDLLSTTCLRALALPDYRDRLLENYALPANENRAQFLALENQEEDRWRKARARW
jgi:tripartite-type tricarboxylate transporter receptor subunit TctC